MRYPSIVHHGATTGVTGSCHQLQMDDEHPLLIDCGLVQGAETSSAGRAGAGSLAPDFSMDGKALVATHAHVGRVGRIAYLLQSGFKGSIFCSESSARLLPVVLKDAFKPESSRGQKQVQGRPCAVSFYAHVLGRAFERYMWPALEGGAIVASYLVFEEELEGSVTVLISEDHLRLEEIIH